MLQNLSHLSIYKYIYTPNHTFVSKVGKTSPTKMAINGSGVRVDEPTLVPLLDHSSSNTDLTSKTTDHELEPPLHQRFLTESKKLWHIVGPAIFSRIASYSMFVITQAFAGHLGDLELAAISIATSVIVGFDFGLLVHNINFLVTLM